MNLKSHIIVRPTNMAHAFGDAARRSIIAAPNHNAVPWTAKRVAINEERQVGTLKEFGITLPKREEGVTA